MNEKTDGRVQVKIFPNGQLGSENENLEQLQAGVIAMTKVSAPGLATYNEAYNAFGLPYIFNDTEDFYHVMDSQQMQDFFLTDFIQQNQPVQRDFILLNEFHLFCVLCHLKLLLQVLLPFLQRCKLLPDFLKLLFNPFLCHIISPFHAPLKGIYF